MRQIIADNQSLLSPVFEPRQIIFGMLGLPSTFFNKQRW
jgi:hypothetical protein